MTHARPFWTFTLQELSNDIKNASIWGVLTPSIALWVFGNPRGLPSPIFESVSGDLTLPSKWGCDTGAHSSSHWQLVLFIMFSYNTLIPTQTMPHFSRFRSGEGYMKISSQPPLVHYIYICACISFWLISLYLWLALIFLFSKIYYGFTPLRHHTSQHYTSQQLSCSYMASYMMASYGHAHVRF